MSNDAEKAKAKDSGARPGVVDLRDRVPQMEDSALAALKANAVRLKEQGTTQQRAAATDLLPVVEAEIARRRAEKAASAPAKAPRGTKKKQAAQPDPE